MAHEALWHRGRIGQAFILGAPVWGLFTESKRSHNAVAIIVLLAFGWSVASRADFADLQNPSLSHNRSERVEQGHRTGL